jgi:DNA modification methylase
MLEVRPLVVADGVVVGGNMRLLVMKDLGYKEVPAIDVTEWTQAERDEFMIKDNLNYGDWDYDMLANEWVGSDLTDWGMDVWDTEPEEMQGLTDEDDVPLAPEEPTTKLGDVWILGEHRVMCGDSTSKEAVEILMNGEKADMVFTDPPYGMSLETNYKRNLKEKSYNGLSNSNRGNYSKVIGDHKDFTPSLINTVFENFGYCKEIFLWGADYYSELLPNRKDGSWIVWDKRKGLEEVEFTLSSFELCFSKTKHQRDIIRTRWFGVHGMETQDTKERNHPTQKPLELITEFVRKWGNKKNLIVDIYLGSGSTLIAAEKTKRKCYGMELDPKYCDVIVKRWEDFTGKKATKE